MPVRGPRPLSWDSSVPRGSSDCRDSALLVAAVDGLVLAASKGCSAVVAADSSSRRRRSLSVAWHSAASVGVTAVISVSRTLSLSVPDTVFVDVVVTCLSDVSAAAVVEGLGR